MHILIVAATPYEIAPTLQLLESDRRYASVETLVTGVGISATVFGLTHCLLLRDRPDFVINAGVAGVYGDHFELGAVVHVISEQYGDLGARDRDGRFMDVFELGLQSPHQFPYREGRLVNPDAARFGFLPSAHGNTVHTVHGSADCIADTLAKYPEVQVESMEGAAVFEVCNRLQQPFVEVRSISNRVEPRNRDAWQLGSAIDALNEVLAHMLDTLLDSSTARRIR